MIISHTNELPLEKCPALVLNADYRPLSYYPLSLWCWQDVVRDVFLDRVNVVSEYDREIRSPSFSMKLPSVISLKTFIKPSEHPNFTRFNVFLRDDFTCQYCYEKLSTKELTFDHLIPRSKGGLTNWENVVTACSHCNWSKGSKNLAQAGFKLLKKPKEPSQYSLRLKSKKFPSDYLHSSWRDYLYWDSILEKD